MHARWQLTICVHSVFSEFQSVFCRHVSQNVTETWRFDGDSWKLHVFHACDFYYHFFPKSQSKTFAHLWINRCQTGKRTPAHCSLHLQSEKDLIVLKWCRYNDDELSLFQGHIEELNDFISKCHLKFQDETNESVFGKIYLKPEVLCTHDSVIGWFISEVLLRWWRPNCCRLQQDSFMWRSTKLQRYRELSSPPALRLLQLFQKSRLILQDIKEMWCQWNNNHHTVWMQTNKSSHSLWRLFSLHSASFLHWSASLCALLSHWSLKGPLLKVLPSSFLDNILLDKKQQQNNSNCIKCITCEILLC